MKLNEGSDVADDLDRTLFALADPTRRAILERLLHGESRVTDLAAPFAMSLAAVSKHVQVLERAKLVRRRKAWREHWVSFDPAPLVAAAAWMERQRRFWSDRLALLDGLLRAEDAAAAAPSGPAGPRESPPGSLEAS